MAPETRNLVEYVSLENTFPCRILENMFYCIGELVVPNSETKTWQGVLVLVLLFVLLLLFLLLLLLFLPSFLSIQVLEGH